MCKLCPVIDDELMLAEIDRELMLAEADAGVSVPAATRALTEPERRAKVRFGDIDKLERDAEAEAAAEIGKLFAVIGDELTAALFGDADAVAPADLAKTLTGLLAVQSPTVQNVVDNTGAALAGILNRVYAGSSAIVLDEARRQGVDVGKLKPKTAPPAPDVKLAGGGFFDALAGAVASALWQRVTGALQKNFLSPTTLLAGPVERAAVEKVIADTGTAGAEDEASQAIHSARGKGRYDTAEELDPEDIWASELLDGATCDPCAKVDGKEYATLAEARVEYETGGYGACKGGARCRGTLVMIYGGTSPKLPPEPPTLPVLPDAPTPPPVPKKRTPRAPKVAPPAPAAPAPATPAPSPAPGMPPAPTAAPPKRRKGTVQRYEAVNQLPIAEPDALKLAPKAVALDTNPGYQATKGADKNYSHNCSSVVQAYEMQRRGYAVKAAPVKAGKGRYDEQYVGEWWKDANGDPVKMLHLSTRPKPQATMVDGKKVLPNSSIEAKAKLDEYLDTLPDGSRGFIALHWAKGGGHVFSWEKVNGKPVFLEGQTGNVDAARHLAPGKFKPASLRVVRIDDKIPTDAVTEALETRPPEYLAELAGKMPAVATMKAMSQHRVMTMADGNRKLILAKYRVNPFTRKWEEIPPDVLAQVQAEFERTEKIRKGLS